MSPADNFSIKSILVFCILENKFFLISSLISNDGLAIKRSWPNCANFCIKNTINDFTIISNTFLKSPEPIAGIKFPARKANIGQHAT